MAFRVDIINIEDNVNNILLTDDLTIEILKVRYNWILNANVKNAVLGLDDYGLVWYMGEWICGEWEDGTWYSGIFHDGIWKNGRWYSYLLDKAMVLSKRLTILGEDKIYSQFLNGKWLNGNWYNGIFGNDGNISGKTITEVSSGGLNCPYWYNGNWYNGLFKNSVWKNGVYLGGNFLNSYWMNGKFYNGTFDNYEWWNGSFYGGDFIKGIWSGGTFNQIDTTIPARFGTCTGTTLDGTLTIWETGVFEKGEFMSGLYFDDSGNTRSSLYHNTTHWLSGMFNNGNWWGGHFETGNFNYGNWYGGVFNKGIDDSYTQLTTWKNGLWYDGLWLNGTFKSGTFFGGMWMNGIFENGFLVSLFTGIITTDMKTNVVPTVLPAPPPPPIYTSPTVTTDSAVAGGTYDTATVNGTVTNDGGLFTTRGICYSQWNLIPNITDDLVITDGTGIGPYSCIMAGLSPLTQYYVRSWATNVPYGTSYGTILTVTTISAPASVPIVSTISATGMTDTTVDLTGNISSDGGSSIIILGFRYSTSNPIPYLALIPTYTPPNPTPSIPSNYTVNVTGLNPETTYYYQAYAENLWGKAFGVVKSFKTKMGVAPGG